MDTFRRRLGLESPSEGVTATTVEAPATRTSVGGRLYPALPAADDEWAEYSSNAAPADGSDVKQKLRSMWNNVKYGRAAWTLQEGGAGAGVVTGDHRGPVWLMGRCYDRRRRAGKSQPYQRSQERHPVDPHPRFASDESMQAAFQLDFASRLWFTYRKEFQEFDGTTMNTDCGWGCMIRKRFAHAKVWSELEVERRRQVQSRGISFDHIQDDVLHRSVIRLFGDCPDAAVAPMSIHNLVSIADEVLGRQPGDWFGPAATAHLLREAVDRSSHPMLDAICVYVARDCTVFRQDVRDLCLKAREKRRRNRRQRCPSAVNAGEDFSLLQVPVEYGGVRVGPVDVEGAVEAVEVEEDVGGFRIVEPKKIDEKLCKSSRHGSGSIKASELCQTRITTTPADFTLLSDGTEHFALNRYLYVEGEQWMVEGRAVDASNARNTATAGSVEMASVATEHPTAVNDNDGGAITPEGDWTPLLLLIPLRLGRDRMNMAYFPALRDLLTRPDCIGVIGGRPKHSLYFLGFQDEHLIHMDPHLVQDHVNVFRSMFNVDSFHCKTPRKMHISKMDPSCCVGFYFQTRASFESWCEEVSGGECGGGAYGHPMFGVSAGCVADADAAAEASLLMAASMTASINSDDGRGGSAQGFSGSTLMEDVSEDFVFL